jgi:twinkle protein
MKFQSSNTKQIHDLSFESNGKKRYQCPECSNQRKKQRDPCLEYHSKENRAYCWHCNTTFFEYKPYDKKQFIVPEWKNKTELTDRLVKWFTGRKISQDTLIKMKIYSDTEYMPQLERDIEVICFPYFLDEKLVNIKFRGQEKTFKMVSGAELILWNINCLKNYNTVIITEGEIDALTYVENGFDNVLSVPNGANKNLEYLDGYIDLFKPIEKILLSVDNDSKGIELRDELIRRFGAEKCLIIDLKECKDANEFLCKYSGLELQDAVKTAKQVPVKGIILIDDIYSDILDLYETGIKPGLKIDNEEIDDLVTWELARFVIATGVPGSGKGEVIDYIVSKLNLLYGWKVAYFTPENYPLKFHYAKIYEKLIGKKFKKDNTIEFDMAYEYIKENYFYILNEENLTPESVLNSAKILVETKGINILVVDPWNKLDHQIQKGDNETQYTSKTLDKLINFGLFNNVLVILVAHPRIIYDGKIPNLYNISGSAHFYNKCDRGFTVNRLKNDDNIMLNEIEIHWQKERFKHLGTQGISNLKYNYINGRFQKNDAGFWDNTNWLTGEKQAIQTQLHEFDFNNIQPKSEDVF